MYTITYMKDGTETEFTCDDYLDLIDGVALRGIKDEDFISMDLDGESITGGINGLALYALRYTNRIREERKALRALSESLENENDCDCEDCEECENCQCNSDDNDTPELMDNATKSAYNDMIDSFNSLMENYNS